MESLVSLARAVLPKDFQHVVFFSSAAVTFAIYLWWIQTNQIKWTIQNIQKK